MMVLLVVFPVVPVEDVLEVRADVSVPGQLLFNIFLLGLTFIIYFNVMAAHFFVTVTGECLFMIDQHIYSIWSC